MKRQTCIAAIALMLLSFLVMAEKAPSTNSHHPQAFLQRIQGTPNEGEQIVQHYCVNCHAERPLISLGAPRMGHASDWAPRLKQGTKVLWQHTDEGLGAMPARGGCFECSDKQLHMAIEYLLKKNN